MYASSIAGELPPDQALPEVWITDDDELERGARAAARAAPPDAPALGLPRPAGELVDGPFEQCWNCGAAMPQA